MLEVVIAYLFSECLFLASSELSYTISRTGIDPSNLKVQIGGTIDISASSDSEEKFRVTPRDGHPDNVLRMPNDTASGHESYDDDGGPTTLDSAKTTGEITKADHSEEKNEEDNDGTDASRGKSKENSASDGDSKPAVKESIEANKTDALDDKEVSGETDKPEPIREVNTTMREENNTVQKEISHGTEQNMPKPVFLPVVPQAPQLRIVTTTMTTTTKLKPHRVHDDEKIRNFSQHVYKQALNAFESMKKKTDEYTQKKIDNMAETYKDKFIDFVKRTSNTRIKTSQGTQNAILHTIDTSNLILERIVNFLKTDMLAGSSALRQGGASRLQKEVDTLKTTEFEHACKMFGVCRSAQGFRNELQDIISTFLSLPDDKLLKINDAITEILKNADFSAFTHSNPIKDRIRKALRAQEITDAASLRSDLEILYAVLSKSHQPLIVDNAFERPAVQRTVAFHGFLDALDDALPATEANRKEWAGIKNKLNRFKDGANLDIQEPLEALFHNVNSGVEKFGRGNGKIREMVKNIVNSVAEDEEY